MSGIVSFALVAATLFGPWGSSPTTAPAGWSAPVPTAQRQMVETTALPSLDVMVIEHFPTLAVSTEFRDDWGDRRSGGRRHRGTDVYALKGTPIVAVADGFVQSMHEGGKGGYMLRLIHADGWESWYMHLDNDTAGTDDGQGGDASAYAAGLAPGDFVAAGTVIAYIGDSGNAETGAPHLHFELHHRGRKVNPHPHLLHAWVRYVRTLSLGGSML